VLLGIIGLETPAIIVIPLAKLAGLILKTLVLLVIPTITTIIMEVAGLVVLLTFSLQYQGKTIRHITAKRPAKLHITGSTIKPALLLA